MTRIWVVAASQQLARLFETESISSPLTEIEDFIDPSARLHARELETDRPGRHPGGVSGSRHAMTPRSDVKDEALRVFTTDLCAGLRDAHHSGRFDELMLIAEPQVLGELRARLDDTTRKAVRGELARNLVKQSPAEIGRHLAECH